MHTRMSSTDLMWWVGILAIQACLASSSRHSMQSLRAFLGAETVLGMVLLIVARIAGPWTYFYSWMMGTVVHHGLCAFLVWELFSAVKQRGLPNRQSVWPIVVITFLSILLGAYYANASYGVIQNSSFKLVMPMDHALSFSLGCMIAALPFFSMYVSASIPRRITFVMVGLAIYEFSYAGLLGAAISRNPQTLGHAVDFVYLISLFLWSLSFHSKRPSVAAERSTLAI